MVTKDPSGSFSHHFMQAFVVGTIAFLTQIFPPLVCAQHEQYLSPVSQESDSQGVDSQEKDINIYPALRNPTVLMIFNGFVICLSMIIFRPFYI